MWHVNYNPKQTFKITLMSVYIVIISTNMFTAELWQYLMLVIEYVLKHTLSYII